MEELSQDTTAEFTFSEDGIEHPELEMNLAESPPGFDHDREIESLQQELGPLGTANIESLAQNYGWKPKSEFKGNQDNWIDAKSFMDKRLKEYESLKDQIGKLESTVTRITSQQEQQELQELQKKLENIQQMIDDAVDEGDTKRVRELTRELVELESRRSSDPSSGNTKEPQIDPLVIAWVEQNPWFNSDAHLRKIAIDTNNYYLSKGYTVEQTLEKVDQAMALHLGKSGANPLSAPNQGRRTVNDVGGGVSLGSGDNMYGLDAEAYKFGMSLVRSGDVKDIQTYAKYYNEAGGLLG